MHRLCSILWRIRLPVVAMNRNRESRGDDEIHPTDGQKKSGTHDNWKQLEKMNGNVMESRYDSRYTVKNTFNFESV